MVLDAVGIAVSDVLALSKRSHEEHTSFSMSSKRDHYSESHASESHRRSTASAVNLSI